MVVLALICALTASGLRFKFDDTDEGAPKSKVASHCAKQPDTPTECGTQDRWSHEELKAELSNFKGAWARHPGGTKMGANHQFAEWFLVRALKPSAIVESGVLQGGSTWGLRDAAGPDTPIFSFDPTDQTSKGFHDENPNTQYYMNENWKDVSLANWDALIPQANRSTALVILDDHQSFLIGSSSLRTLVLSISLSRTTTSMETGIPAQISSAPRGNVIKRPTQNGESLACCTIRHGAVWKISKVREEELLIHYKKEKSLGRSTTRTQIG